MKSDKNGEICTKRYKNLLPEVMSNTIVAVTTGVTSILIIICIIGNSLVCAVIKRNRDMRTPINYLLVNIAVADIFYSTFHVSELIFRHIPTKPEGLSGKAFCFLRNSSIQWIGAACSASTLVVIAVERYFAVRNLHGNQRNLSKGTLKVIISSSWIFSIVLTLPAFFATNQKPDTNDCLPQEQWMYQLGIVSLSVFILFSSVVMAALYSRVIYTLWFKYPGGLVLPPDQQAFLKVRKRVTLMVMTVTAMFTLFWYSDVVIHLLERFYFFKRLLLPRAIVHTMLMFNASLNPFAYALLNQRFRGKIKEMVFRGPQLPGQQALS
ncbi:G-protein coupled receptor 83-like [Montipora capricornis]|uniref:G-protein coupled receptor 83-like n=1 Tax=Montipora capricornis TaxID=246305 RepID=UPI0035F19AB5